MRSLPRVPRSAPRPRLRVQLTVAAVSLSAGLAALVAGEPAPPAIATQQIVIVTDLGAGQAPPTVVSAPPPAAGGATPIRPPVTASR